MRAFKSPVFQYCWFLQDQDSPLQAMLSLKLCWFSSARILHGPTLQIPKKCASDSIHQALHVKISLLFCKSCCMTSNCVETHWDCSHISLMQIQKSCKSCCMTPNWDCSHIFLMQIQKVAKAVACHQIVHSLALCSINCVIFSHQPSAYNLSAHYCNLHWKWIQFVGVRHCCLLHELIMGLYDLNRHPQASV